MDLCGGALTTHSSRQLTALLCLGWPQPAPSEPVPRHCSGNNSFPKLCPKDSMDRVVRGSSPTTFNRTLSRIAPQSASTSPVRDNTKPGLHYKNTTRGLKHSFQTILDVLNCRGEKRENIVIRDLSIPEVPEETQD